MYFKKRFNKTPIVLGNWGHIKKGKNIIPKIIKSIKNIRFKQLNVRIENSDINRFNKTCYGSKLKFGSINKNNKLIIHGTSQSFSKETHPIDINYKNIIIRVPTTHTDKCSIKSLDWNRFWIHN